MELCIPFKIAQIAIDADAVSINIHLICSQYLKFLFSVFQSS